MKVIKPVNLTNAMLVSSNAAEIYPAYSADTTYALGDRVSSGRNIYECIQAPSLGYAVTNALWWAIASVSNGWAMFDNEVSTQTVQASEISVTLAPGYVNSLTLFNLDANTLRVNITDGAGGPNVYSKTVNLDRVYDWYQYFFSDLVTSFDVVLTDLPPYFNAQVNVSLTTGSGNPVRIGQLGVGNFAELGDAGYGATASIIDFSRKETSASGVTTFVRRSFSKRMSINLQLSTAQISQLQRVLSDLRATPCAWVGVDDVDTYSPLLVWGFYRDFSIEVAYPTISYCSLEIEGLI